MSLIAASHASVRFGGTEVLHDISLRVDAAEIVTIVGPNGSGKSTLLRALLGIAPLASGRVSRRPGLRIGYVPQRLQIDRTLPMTARRFLSLPIRQTPVASAAAQPLGRSPLGSQPTCALASKSKGRVEIVRGRMGSLTSRARRGGRIRRLR
jgi:zinc transport system ATP-binding protein